jgi:hypothetical protein
MAVGLANKGFDIDLSEALLREEKLDRILRHAKIELKTDMLAHKTGNVFIEFECSGKPSGIATTTAGFWMIELPGICYYLVDTQVLKDKCKLAYKQNRYTKGGDNDQTIGVLLPLTWLSMQMDKI